jgi:hypothetical protein
MTVLATATLDRKSCTDAEPVPEGPVRQSSLGVQRPIGQGCRLYPAIALAFGPGALQGLWRKMTTTGESLTPAAASLDLAMAR